jgi:hypothetical protein
MLYAHGCLSPCCVDLDFMSLYVISCYDVLLLLLCCRDPFALRAEQLGEEGQVLSDWDRFARGEYLRLAVEEEPEDMQVGYMLHCYVVLFWPCCCTDNGSTGQTLQTRREKERCLITCAWLWKRSLRTCRWVVTSLCYIVISSCCVVLFPAMLWYCTRRVPAPGSGRGA